MSFENKRYAFFYDLLYKKKNYFKEANILIKNIKQNKQNAKSILELGCGTGNYSNLFEKKGFNIHSVDISKSMIDIAKKKYSAKKIKFICKDLRKLNLSKKFDVVIALFDILSFQTSNSDVNKFFNTINKHINKNGIIIFDFWFKDAIQKLKPSNRVKEVENHSFKIVKVTEPNWNKKNNIIEVNYNLLAENKSNNKIEFIKGSHKLRYFALTEIRKYFKKYNFKIIKSLSFLKKNKKDSWSILSIAKKI